MSDRCHGVAESGALRERLLTWLAEGSREVTWALCTLARERWAELPPDELGAWPALRHVRHVTLRQEHLTLPAVRAILGPRDAEGHAATMTFEQLDAAWDSDLTADAADELLRSFAAHRFELLQALESAPDEAFSPPAPIDGLAAGDGSSGSVNSPAQLAGLLLRARQYELEHVARIWKIALYWDSVAPAPSPGVPYHPADRFPQGVTLR